MNTVDGNCNSITKFLNVSAHEYAKNIEEKNNDIAFKKATKLIKYIESRYEKKIKETLRKDPKCRYTVITLPFFQKASNGDIQERVEKIVESHFESLGFIAKVVLERNCDCILNYVCNYNSFIIRLNW